MTEVLGSLQDDLEFGSGQYLGVLLNTRNDEFETLTTRDQALLLGYANACPVAQWLTNPNNPGKNRGPDKMLERYGEVNFWFRHAVHLAEEDNPALAAQLKAAIPRQEPSGESFEKESVPISFYSEMSLLGTLYGYAASRIFVNQIGSKDLPPEESRRRLDTGLRILEHSVRNADSGEAFLALLAEGVANTGDVEPKRVLADALSAGWFGEHHAAGKVHTVETALRTHAENLWGTYQSLSTNEKLKDGILVSVPEFEAAAGPLSIEGLRAYHNGEFGYTLWEGVTDPESPEGPHAIVMHVPAGSMSRTWELVADGYSERVELLRGSGRFVFKHTFSDVWVPAPLDAEHPTADDVSVGQSDQFCVVAGSEGAVVLSRPSKPFEDGFEQALTNSPEDETSKTILARVALAS